MSSATGSGGKHHALPRGYPSPPLIVVCAVILLFFLFMGFFVAYFCRCFWENLFSSWNIERTPSGDLRGTTVSNGIDPSLLDSFPTFTYSTVKDYRKEKYGLECAICLLEFEDQSLLRLLTVCYHVFHQECVDLWLETHKTCPVCRRDLDSPLEMEGKSPELNVQDHQNHSTSSVRGSPTPFRGDNADHICIDVMRERDDDEKAAPTAQQKPQKRGDIEKQDEVGGGFCLCRSHSTGHSIVMTDKEEEGVGRGGNIVVTRNEDRYTLRVPEHVKIKIVRGHNWTRSCTTYKEMTKLRACNCGFGELSGNAFPRDKSTLVSA